MSQILGYPMRDWLCIYVCYKIEVKVFEDYNPYGFIKIILTIQNHGDYWEKKIRFPFGQSLFKQSWLEH